MAAVGSAFQPCGGKASTASVSASQDPSSKRWTTSQQSTASAWAVVGDNQGCQDEIGSEVAALLQERHLELMRSIELWLRHEEDMVRVMLRNVRNKTVDGGPAVGPTPSAHFDLEREASFRSDDGSDEENNDEQRERHENSTDHQAPTKSVLKTAKTLSAMNSDGSARRRDNESTWSEQEQEKLKINARKTKMSRINKTINRVNSMWSSNRGPADLSDDDYKAMALNKVKSKSHEFNHQKDCVSSSVQPRVRPLKWASQKLVQSPIFTGVVFMVILTNICLVGVETDYSAGGLGQLNSHGDKAFFLLSTIYTGLFSIELAIRVTADGCAFFYKENWHWNWFETLIVALSMVDSILSSIKDENGASLLGGQNWVIRLFRIVRILRTLRIVRVVSFIREVVLVIQSITATLKSLVWAMVLMLIILYGFGIVFTQVVSDYRNTEENSDDTVLVRHWSTLPRSILSLFEAVTGGVNWLEILMPLYEVSWTLIVLFLVFFIFVYFCLLNVMTAVFCQNAIESATLDKEMASLALMAKKQQWSEEMRGIFVDMDKGQTGMVDVEEFEKYLNDERMRAFLESREIDVHDAWTLFKLLDNDQRGVIELDNFVEGLLQLKGPAKAMQIAKVLHDAKVMRHQLQSHMHKVEERLDQLLIKDVMMPKVLTPMPCRPQLQDPRGQEICQPIPESLRMPELLDGSRGLPSRSPRFEPVEPIQPSDVCAYVPSCVDTEDFPSPGRSSLKVGNEDSPSSRGNRVSFHPCLQEEVEFSSPRRPSLSGEESSSEEYTSYRL